jgi:ferric-dicitrate binding protein FerR (iron transport regulator)
MWTSLGEKIEPAWAPEREDAVRAAIARRATRRRAVVRTAVAVASTGMIAVGGFALVRWQSAGPVAAPSVSSARAVPNPPPAGGGGETVTVTRLSSDTVLAPLPDREWARVRAARRRGAVLGPHDPDRPFVVAAGNVTIEDLGTTFTVRYLTADRLKIAVEEGRVRVRAAAPIRRFRQGATLEVPVSPAVVSTAFAGPGEQRPPPWRRRHGGHSPSVVNTKRRGGRCGRRVRAPCATTPPICCWPPTPLA